MHVICIKTYIGWNVAARLVGSNIIQVGDECTVIDTYKCACGKHDKYDLKEFPLLGGFDARCFATMPESDADEMQDAEREAIVPDPQLN